MRAPRPASHRTRFAVGVALAAALGACLAWLITSGGVQAETAGVERRQAVVSLQALSSLVARTASDPEALRRAVATWQAQAKNVSQARVLFMSGLRLEASTAPGDTGELAAPRRLKREEKPFYDRGQRIKSSIATNRDEGAARKPEIEIAPAPAGRRLSIAGPIEQTGEVTGMVEIETVELPSPAGEPWWPFAAGAAAALAAFAVGALIVGRRRYTLAALAVVCVGATLFVLGRLGAGHVVAARHAVAQSVADQVTAQAALVKAQSAAIPAAEGTPVVPSHWDVNAYRQPLGLLTEAGAVDQARLDAAGAPTDRRVRYSLLAAGALALVVLLVVGLGGFNWLGRTMWDNRRAYAYIAPAMIGMTLLVMFPFIYGILLSFTNANLYNSLDPPFNGLENYTTILGDFNIVKHTATGWTFNYLNFYYTLGFTIIWTVTNVTIGVTSGLILALILNTKGLAARPVYRVLLILPWATPNYITALIWKGMFHRQFGVINHMLQMFGAEPLSWFDHPFTSYLTALATNGWLSFPFMMVVSLGALQSIPTDIYEAARVDGANRWQAFKAITLPSLRPALVPAVIISVVWTFNMFNIIYLVTAGEPAGATEILVTQSYKYAFERYRYGYAAAYSTVIFIILLIYGTIQIRVSKATEA